MPIVALQHGFTVCPCITTLIKGWQNQFLQSLAGIVMPGSSQDLHVRSRQVVSQFMLRHHTKLQPHTSRRNVGTEPLSNIEKKEHVLLCTRQVGQAKAGCSSEGDTSSLSASSVSWCR
jgi:hypothetical protein